MFTYVENFYNNANQIYEIVSKLDYKQETFGLQIKDFYLVPQGIDEGFSQILGKKINLGEKSGLFRKPYEFIHFENFNPKSLYLGIIALSDIKFYTYKHKEKNYHQVIDLKENVQDFIVKNCNNKDLWDVASQVNMSAGDIILVKPWCWHSLDSGLVNIFYIETEEQISNDSTSVMVEVHCEKPTQPIENNLPSVETDPTPDTCFSKGTC